MELSWQEFAKAEPELATFGEARFRQGIAFLATIRQDGSPRVHPVMADLIEGHLLVFMEPTSPKVQDLLRDGRYSLHAFVAPFAANGEFLCRGAAKALTGELRTRFGTKAPNMQERYVLFEFFIKEAFRTVYVEKKPIRTRWPRK
jgi:Pyridoxamine 5'-phosphate oxidase